MNYKIQIAYNGTNYKGWAKQPDQKTIYDEIYSAFWDLFKIRVNINASGRTDAGVHAFAQVISISHDKLSIKPIELKRAINSRLSRDIKIIDVQIAHRNFHARFSAANKTYLYKIDTQSEFDVFKHNIIYQYNKRIYLNKIKRVSKILLGEHDFLSFSTTEVKNTIRIINYIKFKRKKSEIWIYINANGFLRNMVRMIVGVLLACNEGKISDYDIQLLLANPKKGAAIYKVPGCGLYLEKVYYGNNK